MIAQNEGGLHFPTRVLYLALHVCVHKVAAVLRRLTFFPWLIMANEEVGSHAFSFDDLVNIFSYLPPESLSKCSQVCRDWHEASQVGTLWKRHCLQRWNFCHLAKLKPGTVMYEWQSTSLQSIM